jgi:hypothetical protein
LTHFVVLRSPRKFHFRTNSYLIVFFDIICLEFDTGRGSSESHSWWCC